MKRVIDLAVSAAGLLILWPVLLLIALVVWVTDRGPVLFKQERIGRFGKPFHIYKFRTMHASREAVGQLITVSGDQRITPVGRFLRRWKMDELPQLINVLRGDMSLVGPRPEVAEYVERFLKEYEPLLSLRPGLTHRAAIVFRNEEDLLASAADPERYYVERVMPRKLAIYREELERDSVANDLKTIIDTVLAIANTSGAGPALPSSIAESGRDEEATVAIGRARRVAVGGPISAEVPDPRVGQSVPVS